VTKAIKVVPALDTREIRFLQSVTPFCDRHDNKRIKPQWSKGKEVCCPPLLRFSASIKKEVKGALKYHGYFSQFLFMSRDVNPIRPVWRLLNKLKRKDPASYKLASNRFIEEYKERFDLDDVFYDRDYFFMVTYLVIRQAIIPFFESRLEMITKEDVADLNKLKKLFQGAPGLSYEKWLDEKSKYLLDLDLDLDWVKKLNNEYLTRKSQFHRLVVDEQ
jgi:hypothetical protein